MDDCDKFRHDMPAMLDHAGQWEGVYTHIDGEANVLDRHRTRIHCEFPTDGPYVYIQHNHFQWDDGREHRATLPGRYREGRLWWDTDTFHGSAWQTLDNIIMLNLSRKDDPGAHFIEVIAPAHADPSKPVNRRARTWHWFKDGHLFKRTLCDEWRVAP